LVELQTRYQCKSPFTDTFWSNWRINLRRFRAEGHYLAQRWGRSPEAQYVAAATYTELVDDWKLMFALQEDGLFGCHTYRVRGDLQVSRDLLDSILEITFLRRCLAVQRGDRLRVLDIGAGYGRFAHRFLTAFPAAFVANVDGVAISTFLCEFYLNYRGLGQRCSVVPIDEIEELPRGCDLAVNIHSWSECTRETVKYWVRILCDIGVRVLFVVPHDEELTTMEPGGLKDTFLPEIFAGGFRLRHKVQKFNKSTIMCSDGLQPAWYFLFER
jgi:SAM-dependent methyltransferase